MNCEQRLQTTQSVKQPEKSSSVLSALGRKLGKFVQRLKLSNLETILHRHPKIIFLDVDGVLNRGFDVDPNNEIERKRCLYLAYLVYRTNAKIVVHSSWKYNKGMLAKLRSALKECGLHIYDVTPTILGEKCGRVNEIRQWMSEHTFDEKHWVVLDDWVKPFSGKNHSTLTGQLIWANGILLFDQNPLSGG